jgi:hypothetical protein
MTIRDPRTGRYVRTANVPSATEGKFETYVEMPVDDASGAPSANTIDRPRYAPDADELAQFDARSPLRVRNPVIVHPDDEGHHNAILRTAARQAGPMDSSPFLTGLVGFPAPSGSIQDTSVELHGDHNPLSPGADLLRQFPSRTLGRVRVATDDEPMGTPHGDLPPSSRGLGRGRDR